MRILNFIWLLLSSLVTQLHYNGYSTLIAVILCFPLFVDIIGVINCDCYLVVILGSASSVGLRVDVEPLSDSSYTVIWLVDRGRKGGRR